MPDKTNKYKSKNPFLAKSISRRDFIDDHQIPNNPVLINNLTKEWKSLNINLVNQLFQNQTFKIGEDGVEIKFKLSCQTSYENPIYLFDNDLDKCDVEGKPLHAYYQVPDLFSDNLFQVMGESRPQYRWILYGPKRSGSLVHIDPYMTSAWNTSLEGQKEMDNVLTSHSEINRNWKYFVNEGLIPKEDTETLIAYFYKVLPLFLSNINQTDFVEFMQVSTPQQKSIQGKQFLYQEAGGKQ